MYFFSLDIVCFNDAEYWIPLQGRMKDRRKIVTAWVDVATIGIVSH